MPSDITKGYYRHYKGNYYEVIATARHSESQEVMVVYRALYGSIGLWVRPAKMFSEWVVVDGVKKRRFERVADAVSLL